MLHIFNRKTPFLYIFIVSSNLLYKVLEVVDLKIRRWHYRFILANNVATNTQKLPSSKTMYLEVSVLLGYSVASLVTGFLRFETV
jgi:hypothetical protein